MKRILLLTTILILAVLTGCGGSTKKHTTTHNKVSPVQAVSKCQNLPEGQGRMGVCVPKTEKALRNGFPSPKTTFASNRLGIDTSHWDYCSSAIKRGPRFWFVSVGDGNYVDPCQHIVTNMLHSAGIPNGTYYFTRQNLNPVWSADHYASLIRGLGSQKLLPVNDAEAISSCSWIYTFDNRLKSDLHVRQVIDYDSPGLWSGCSGNGNVDWTAAYGPYPYTLRGFSSWSVWQFTDGQVGPNPHCWGVCGDIDVLSSSNLPLIPTNKPKPKPKVHTIPYADWHACSLLDNIQYWKTHGGHGHVSVDQHNQAVFIRAALKKVKIGCAAPGWFKHPPRKGSTYPYRYPERKGALA